jgi:Tfp pilus assembly protein PilO
MSVQGEGDKMNFNFMRQLPKDKQQKLVLVGIVTLIAVVGTLQFYVLKNWTALRNANNRIAKVNEQIQEAEHKLKQAAQNEMYRQEVKAFVETQQAAMIAGDPFAWVVREISLLAEGRPIRVIGLNPGSKIESAGKSKCAMYATRIDITGSYDQIGAFICDLENKFPTGEIRSLTVAGGPDDKNQHQALLNLALVMQPEQPSKKTEGKKTS